jgi:hypothetical protein
MSFSSYSATPDNNTSINGINIAENCAAANVNNAIRQLMADGKELSDTVEDIDVSDYMPISGGSFTGRISRSGAGAYLVHNSSSLVSGRIFVQLSSASLPASPAEGDIVFQYSA